MKLLGIGIHYNEHTKKYEASLGKKRLGQYRTLEEAAKVYNNDARRMFAFPILNKNEIMEPEVILIHDILLEEATEVLKELKLEPEKINIIEARILKEGSILSLEESLELLKE